MEKFSQFRDRASGIAPFLPVVGQVPRISLVLHLFLASVRLPLLFSFGLTYFGFLQWLPIGSLGTKAALWSLLGIPGIWWIDLQIEGVRKGSLSQNASRLPQPGTLIAASFTCPIDALYLAAIFDPIFTVSYPSTRKVRQISLLQAILRAFAEPEPTPPEDGALTDVATLLNRYPKRCIAVFPECTTTNGRGILQLSPSLVPAPPGTKIFPVSLRYAPGDVTTPVPNTYFSFLWNLTSKPTHTIRVRIAESITVPDAAPTPTPPHETADPAKKTGTGRGRGRGRDRRPSYDYNYIDVLDAKLASEQGLSDEPEKPPTAEQKELLAHVGDALARLGRVRRVGLGVEEKRQFVTAWEKRAGK